jgi:hypothetical protein
MSNPEEIESLRASLKKAEGVPPGISLKNPL